MAFPLISKLPITSPLNTVCFSKYKFISGHKSGSPGRSGIISSALELFIVTFKFRFGILLFNFVIFPVVKALMFGAETLASLICNPFLIVVIFDFNAIFPT